MTKTMSIEEAMNLMEVSPKGIGGLPATVYLPAACIPKDVTGTVQVAEGGVKLARMAMAEGWAECDRAEASGKAKAIARLTKRHMTRWSSGSRSSSPSPRS